MSGTESDARDGRPVRRRNRQPLSCATCRKRKVRCDRTIPCGPCKRHGMADSCCFEKRGRSGEIVCQSALSGPPEPKDDVNDIRRRLEYLETLLDQQSRKPTPGVTPTNALPRDSLGNLPDNPIRVHNRTGEQVAEIDPEAEDAALVLEGLTMEGTLAFNQHRGRQAMRRAFDKARSSDSPEARRELANEGVIDPIDYSLTAKHAAELAQCHAAQGDKPLKPELDMGDPLDCPMMSACRSKSLLRLESSTESSLGWGLGWALAAAQEMGQFDVIRDTVDCTKVSSSSTASHVTPERLAVLTAIVRTLPTLEQTELLLDIFERRAQPFTMNVVHIPTLRKEVRMMYSLTTPLCCAKAIDTSDTCWLGVLLMVLNIGLRFREADDEHVNAQLGRFVDQGCAPLWCSATKTCLVLSGFIGSTSLNVLTTIVLLMCQCPRSANHSPAMMRIAISNAQGMGLHRLGDLANQPKPGDGLDYRIRQEIAKRLWWSLVVSDWNCALLSTTPYMIQPHQFNTPMPGNFNNDDLLRSGTQPHPDDVFTEISYALSMMELAKITREHVDMVTRLEMEEATVGKPRRIACDFNITLDGKYHGVLRRASVFSDKMAGRQSEELIEVQRWAFQQNVFDRLLQLHRQALSKKQARNCCVELARRVLSMQRDIRKRSDLGDKLVQNVLQSFNATTLLCLDLLYTPPTAIQRETIRSEIAEGLDGMCRAAHDAGLTPRGIRIIRVLLDEEQKQWDAMQKRGKSGQEPQSRTHLLNMALRVARISRGAEPLLEEDENKPIFQEPEPTITKQRRERERQSQALPESVSAPPPTAAAPATTGAVPYPLNALPPFQPSFSSLDPYQIGPSGIEMPMAQDTPAPANMDFDLQSFLDNFELPNANAATNGSLANQGTSNVVQDNGQQNLDVPMSDASSSGPSSSYSSVPPSFVDSHSPSSYSGSGSGSSHTTTHSPSDNSPPVMDGFWDWMLSQGMQADNGNAISMANFNAPSQSVLGQLPPSPFPTLGLDASALNKPGVASPDGASHPFPSASPLPIFS